MQAMGLILILIVVLHLVFKVTSGVRYVSPVKKSVDLYCITGGRSIVFRTHDGPHTMYSPMFTPVSYTHLTLPTIYSV